MHICEFTKIFKMFTTIVAGEAALCMYVLFSNKMSHLFLLLAVLLPETFSNHAVHILKPTACNEAKKTRSVVGQNYVSIYVPFVSIIFMRGFSVCMELFLYHWYITIVLSFY